MSEYYMGEIRAFGFNFAPKGWAMCNGQILSIQQNQALFSLLGTTYGGNGTTTFALPNLRGRAGIHTDDSSYTVGQQAGQESVTLNSSQLPMHTHAPQANVGGPGSGDPTNKVWATSTTAIYGSAVPDEQSKDAAYDFMAANALGNAGGSQPHENQPPSLVVTYAIALSGWYPSRN